MQHFYISVSCSYGLSTFNAQQWSLVDFITTAFNGRNDFDLQCDTTLVSSTETNKLFPITICSDRVTIIPQGTMKLLISNIRLIERLRLVSYPGRRLAYYSPDSSHWGQHKVCHHGPQAGWCRSDYVFEFHLHKTHCICPSPPTSSSLHPLQDWKK